MEADVDVRLLGPLDVRVAGSAVEFVGAKQRTLFSALALRAPEPVPVDDLIEALWGGDPPGGAIQALQKQISRLRERLGDDAPLSHRPAGYALEIERATIDAQRFEDLLRRARTALAGGAPDDARTDLAAALTLWRGPALAEHRFDGFAQLEISRLEELRLEAIEEQMAPNSPAAATSTSPASCSALVAEHPLRERLRAQLMLALYRGGRQAEALETMREGRRMLVDELGIEPGPELRRLERMILAHDPELTAEPRPSSQPATLPAPASTTIGRTGELAEIVELLVRPGPAAHPRRHGRRRQDAARAGGRAGVEERFPGGAVHVNLDGIETRRVLVAEAASALGFVAATRAELGEQLALATRGAPALLVLDGFERFLDDAGQVGQLLAAVANLKVLATSRAALRLTAEHVYPVYPLAAADAAELFVARAAAVRPDTCSTATAPMVDAICARLDGLPLAIELAADRVRLLPLPALLERLDDRLALLTGGPRDLPPRQRSLRATLEWSWDVLEEPEQTLLSRLTVFEGGASLEAAEAVCNAERARRAASRRS